ncbi:hypothetical protein SLE2022_125710 [Rubroshorea leprosula]
MKNTLHVEISFPCFLLQDNHIRSRGTRKQGKNYGLFFRSISTFSFFGLSAPLVRNITSDSGHERQFPGGFLILSTPVWLPGKERKIQEKRREEKGRKYHFFFWDLGNKQKGYLTELHKTF